MSVHICIVSDQILANYLPVKIKDAKKVLLMSSAAMIRKKKTACFEKLLSTNNIEYTTYSDVPDQRIDEIINYLEDIYENICLQNNKDNLVLNITGGTKIMTLAFWDFFKNKNIPVIYIDTYNDTIHYLHNNEVEKVYSTLNIQDYLIAQGVDIEEISSDSEDWCTKVAGRKNVSSYLAENSYQLESFFNDINTFTENVLSKDKIIKNPLKKLTKAPNEIEKRIFSDLHDLGLIEWNNDKDIMFKDPNVVDYLKGFWLEEYVYLAALEANPDHVACGVKISRNSQANNELDVIVVHNNRMLVIECKALKFKIKQVNEIVYKAAEVGNNLKGLFGKIYLVSARDASNQEDKNIILERAKAHNVNLILPNDLNDMTNIISQWMKSK